MRSAALAAALASTLAAAALAACFSVGEFASEAAAMPLAARVPAGAETGLVREVHYACRCARAFPPRRYWRWGFGEPDPELEWHRNSPIGHFWGTPQPPLVPANRWARQWRPPWHRAAHRHRR